MEEEVRTEAQNECLHFGLAGAYAGQQKALEKVYIYTHIYFGGSVCRVEEDVQQTIGKILYVAVTLLMATWSS